MTVSEIIRLRLRNQHLEGPTVEQPEVAVQQLGAVQSQDYLGGRWAVGQRTTGATGASLDQAFAQGKLLRTHVMRPTWHFVTPQDIRWLLALTAPRVKKIAGHYNRQLGLDDALLQRTNSIIVKALQGGHQLTRTELGTVLEQAGIDISVQGSHRLAYIVGNAELDALICSGALRGKQHTYALLDERAPVGLTFTHQQALAELARRYFTSHGPATLKDFAWWSGLVLSEAKTGLQAVQAGLTSADVDGQTYWYDGSQTSQVSSEPSVHLLPNYDEYIVAYADRSAIFDTKHLHKLDARGNPLFNNVVVADGHIVGTWKPVLKRKVATVETKLFEPLAQTHTQALEGAIEKYMHFMK